MGFRVLIALLVPLLLQSNGWADTVQVKPGHPDQYTVVKGDTLWDISGKFFNNPAHWPQVWEYNEQIKNPHLIYPGDTIYFTLIDGKPVLSLNRQMDAKTADSGLFVPKIRETPIEEAIKLIPIESIAPFLTSPRVVAKNELKNAPHMVRVVGEHIVAGAGDRIYARNLGNTGDLVYTIFREGKIYKDVDTDEVLGYEAVYLATATLQKSGEPATLLITEADREIRPGDRLLTTQKGEVALNYFPTPPKTAVKGHIINVLNGVFEIGQYDVIVIDKGAMDGLKSGHILDIYQQREVSDDPYAGFGNKSIQMPDEFAGTVMIFRTFDRVSYGLVMHSENAIHLYDKVASPE